MDGEKDWLKVTGDQCNGKGDDEGSVESDDEV